MKTILKIAGFFSAALLSFTTVTAQNSTAVCEGEQVTIEIQPQGTVAVQWQISTDNVTFTNIPGETNNSLILSAVQTTAYYRAGVTGDNCNPYFSSIEEVAVTQSPTTANAGGNIVDPTAQVVLNANTPVNGTGTWSIVSGVGGSLTNPNDPQATFFGSLGTIYTLAWTIENAPCGVSSDTITVELGGTPPPPPVPAIMCNGQTLYVHPTDNASQVAWGCVGTVTGAIDDWDGATNTATIVQTCTGATAAGVCDALNAFGFSDWYLPANNQLQCLRDEVNTIGGFVTGSYWSSTEGAGIFSANARQRNFPTGSSGISSKSNTHNVRCVRD
ncbi:MAG: DUF1566 domain-containing protein [Schleiferiaceae bacterium]|nr:DUF1566 domain-containing protein [Schleiferiaceae bacterium]